MKKNSLQKTIKITLLILIIILVILSFALGAKIIDKDSNTPIYSTIEEMPDMKTLINQMYGKYIKIEDSSHEKYYKDLYVDLKYGLYEGETSKKIFFDGLIENVAQMMNYQNIRVIDEKKGIELKIVCDTENKKIIGSYINGDVNFYGHYESQLALSKYVKTPITNLNIESSEIKTLILNNWSKNSLSIGEAEEKVDKYIEYGDLGINIYDIDEKVFNLIFDLRYKGNVVNGLKVEDTLETVIQKMGTPTFGSLEEEYIGYKGQSFYVFFNIDEISIYPVENTDVSISNLLKQYERDNSIKKMVSNATDIWENYENYYYDEYTVDLSYPLQGMKFQFGVTENHGVIIYNNYQGKILDNYTQEDLKNLEIEIPSYVYFVAEDSVNEYERERVGFKKATDIENGDFENLEDWKYL